MRQERAHDSWWWRDIRKVCGRRQWGNWFDNNTSAVRAFCPDYFPHFVSGLEPKHIGARPKGIPFGLGCYRSHRVPFMPQF